MLLVVGAGGGFGRVLDAAGVDTAIAQSMGGLRLSPLVLGWVIAALLRVSVGSATVACVTAAGIMAPIVAAMPGANKELLVVVDRRRLAHRVARQRRRLLAREGVPQHERPADGRDVDGARDDRVDPGAVGVLLLGLVVGVVGLLAHRNGIQRDVQELRSTLPSPPRPPSISLWFCSAASAISAVKGSWRRIFAAIVITRTS